MTFKSKLRHLTNRSPRKKKTRKLRKYRHIGGSDEEPGQEPGQEPELDLLYADPAVTGAPVEPTEPVYAEASKFKPRTSNLIQVVDDKPIYEDPSELKKSDENENEPFFEIAGTRTPTQASNDPKKYGKIYSSKDGFVGLAGPYDGPQKAIKILENMVYGFGDGENEISLNSINKFDDKKSEGSLPIGKLLGKLITLSV